MRTPTSMHVAMAAAGLLLVVVGVRIVVAPSQEQAPGAQNARPVPLAPVANPFLANGVVDAEAPRPQAARRPATGSAPPQPAPRLAPTLPEAPERFAGQDDSELSRDADEVATEAFSTWQAQDALLQGHLQAEVVDREFRDSASAALDRAFAEFPRSGVQVRSTDCRRTMCRLELGNQSVVATNAVIGELSERLGWSAELRAHSEIVPGIGVTTVVYLSRDGSDLPVSNR